jgi:hypothetical protein
MDALARAAACSGARYHRPFSNVSHSTFVTVVVHQGRASPVCHMENE